MIPSGPDDLVARLAAETTFDRRLALLRAEAAPTSGFFEALSRWLQEPPSPATRAMIEVGDAWLGERVATDVRDDWGEPDRAVLRAAALFAAGQIGPLALPPDAGPVSNDLLLAVTRAGRILWQRHGGGRLVLAMLNLWLWAAPRSVDPTTGDGRTPEARQAVLVTAAQILGDLGGASDRARALLAEARRLGAIIAAGRQDPLDRVQVALNETMLLDMEGDWDLAEGRVEDAVEQYGRALADLHALEEQADGLAGFDPAIEAQFRTGRANTHWRLAQALTRSWRHDEARDQFERAVQLYRELGEDDALIAGHLRGWGKAEFVAGDPEEAERLLERADWVQEGLDLWT